MAHLDETKGRQQAEYPTTTPILPNTCEAPGCQETDFPYERKFFHFLVMIFRAAQSTSSTVR